MSWAPALIVLILLVAVTVTAGILLSEPQRRDPGFDGVHVTILLMAASAAATLGLLAGFGLATRRPSVTRGPLQPDADRRYSAYWRDTPEGLFTIRVGRDGGFTFDGLNPAHELRTGLKHAKIAGRRLEEVLDKELAAAVAARYRQCVALGAPITYLETIDLPVGRRCWETNLAPLRGRNGEIEILLGSARDVTDDMATRAALVASEERFRGLAELAPDILFTGALDGAVDYLSPRFFEYTGLPPATRGHEPYAAVHPDDVSRLVVRTEATRERPIHTQARIRSHDGEYRWFTVRVRVVDGIAGPRFYGVATDIHKVKRAGEEVEALNAQLTSLLESISDCYYTLDRNWRMTTINPQARAWFDGAGERMLGADIRPDLKPDLYEAICKAFATGEPIHLERPSSYRAGRWIEFHI